MAAALGTFAWSYRIFKSLTDTLNAGSEDELLDRYQAWTATHHTSNLALLAFIAVGIWVAVDAARLLAGKFKDGRGMRITRWV